MTRSATDVMHEILFSAVVDSIVALKAASKGLPNAMLRDINAVHPNTTFADLPQELQAAIQAGVRSAFTKLLKEGYAVADSKSAPPRPRPNPDAPRPRHPGGPRGRGPRPEGPRPPRPNGPRGGGNKPKG